MLIVVGWYVNAINIISTHVRQVSHRCTEEKSSQTWSTLSRNLQKEAVVGGTNDSSFMVVSPQNSQGINSRCLY